MRLCVLILLAACGGEAPVCGDGEVDEREECDDGNRIINDGCTACRLDLPSACGDGVVAFDEGCDDGNVADGDGCSASCGEEAALSMSWSFKDLATGRILGCPPGFDTIRIVTQEVDDAFAPVGELAIDLFSCADGSASSWFEPARYVTFLEAVDSTGTHVYAQSLSYLVDLTTPFGTIPILIVNDGGYFGVRWELRGATSNNLLTCGQAGASSISLLATVTSSTTATEERFTCSHGGALTAPLLGGSYAISLGALNAAEQAVGTSPPLVARTIVAPNKVTDLGLVTIPITGQ